MSIPLYPLSDSFHQEYLKVSDLHELYLEQRGNPQGIPVVILHGGPGAGCRPSTAQYFDPTVFNMILFDQRGSLRSRPFGEMRENTTDDLIDDIERIRTHLNIDRWIISGGSWGSALALLYAQKYTKRCMDLVLRGVTFVDHASVQYLYNGMDKFFPDAYAEMISNIPESERGNLVAAFYSRLMNPDPAIHMNAARAFTRYDLICATLLQNPTLDDAMKDDAFVLSLARTFTHYCFNNFFMNDHRILKDLGKISHLPIHIVHGRYDMICPLESAYILHKATPKSRLFIVPDAGHATFEPGITQHLLQISRDLVHKYNPKTNGHAA